MAQFQLTVKAGPNPGMVYDLDKDEIVLGRDLGNDIMISDADISRRHARFVLQGDVYTVEDLGSTNGTYINGERLAGPHLLMGGETILFGSSVEMEYAAAPFDVNATVIAPPQFAAAPAEPEPVEPEPVVEAPAPEMSFEPTPEQVYEEALQAAAPEAPAAEPAYNIPAPAYEAPAPAEPKSKTGMWIGIGVGCFALACLCIVVSAVVILWPTVSLWLSGAFNSF